MEHKTGRGGTVLHSSKNPTLLNADFDDDAACVYIRSFISETVFYLVDVGECTFLYI